MLVNQNVSSNALPNTPGVNKRINNYSTNNDIKISVYDTAKGQNAQQILIRKNPHALVEKSMNAGRPVISNFPLNADKHIQAKQHIVGNLDNLSKDHSFNTPTNKVILNLNCGSTPQATCNVEGGSACMSKVLMESMQSKERLIHNLKGSMSLDKNKRNKILDNENSRFGEKDSLMHSYIEGEREKDKMPKSSYAIKSNLFSYMNNTKKEEPLKIYTENHMNKTSFNNNISVDETPLDANANHTKCLFHPQSSSTNYPSVNICHSIKASDLERQLEELLKNISIEKETNEKNRMIINAKSYNAYKKIFEEVIKIYPEQSIILHKLLNGYHEVVMNFAGENKTIKDNADIMLNKYTNLNKKYLETSKLLKEKEKEIEILKKRIAQLETLDKSEKEVQEQMNVHQSTEDKKVPLCSHNDLPRQMPQNEENNKASKHPNHIFNMNKKLVEDLDGLYFFDKVHMRANSITPSTVPKLQFTFPAQKSTQKHETNDQQQGYVMKDKEEPHKIIVSKNTVNANQQNWNINPDKITMNNSSNGHLNINEGVLNKILTNSTKATNSSKSIKNELNFKLGINKIEIK